MTDCPHYATRLSTVSQNPPNKITMKMSLKLLAAVAVVSAANLNAATMLMDWGSTTYVTSAASFSNPAPTDSGLTRVYPYSSATAVSPSSGYTGPTFYAAIQYSQASGTLSNITRQIANDNTNGDYISLTTASPTNVSNTLNALIFFKKSDFQNGMSTPTVTLDSTSAFNITRGNGGFTANTKSVRAAVLDGTQWYLSSASVDPTANNTTYTILADASAGMWGTYDPTTTPMGTIPSSFTTPGSSFTNIQAVGFFVDATRTSTGANSNIFASFSGFEASAIPEPATWALLAAVGTFFMVTRRRRRE
jgi:hypothetical protein